ncbi:MAG: hypothetical protein OSP8Acid_06140 [uncultured Acidilobus sp. OSP8]|nr:MAG: hypothetical protein OSP8Acid_06140 [uncultured Acidilobus sp. OSP8]
MRAARALALVIAVIVSASLLAGLSYLVPSLFHRGRIIIRAYAMEGDSGPTQLTNASFSVWAWAPTPNGTEFIPVFNGTGPQAVINLARLVGWAKDWIHAYGKAAIRSFEPSIIIWVSYPIALPNGSVELVTQPSFQPLNLSLPLSGSGAVIDVMVSSPFRALLNPGKGAGIAVRGLAKVSPEQTATTTVTTTITNSTSFFACYYTCAAYIFVPHVIKWYPNNESMAPISLAIALAQPSSVSGGSVGLDILISAASNQTKQFSINGLMIAGAAFDAAVDDAEVGDLFQAISQLSPALGATFTFTTEGEVAVSNITYADIPTSFDDIGQLYMVGQAALVNWTEYDIAWGLGETPTGNWYLGLQLTEFKAVENSSAVAPVIYHWWAYDPCVNLNEWANEQQVLMQDPGDFFAFGMNATCPLPNTPAPVIWQDYAKNLTYYANVSPNSASLIYYLKLSVNGGESPLGIGLDLGSAIASVIGMGLMVLPGGQAAGAVVEVIGALLGAFQYTTTSAAQSANYISIHNDLPPPYYVNVYFSNLTPVYTVSGQSFTLPNELILINVTS